MTINRREFEAAALVAGSAAVTGAQCRCACHRNIVAAVNAAASEV
jgi:aerobic-type carbon monoxide dehydrogenase small subunit (CoxS/CutS family)